jgi:hypothetical protein
LAGRPPGAENKDKPYREALRMEIAAAGADQKLLREIAQKHLALAKSGDMAAIREVADRLDGKPAAEINAQHVHRYVARIPNKATTSEEWQQQHEQPAVH